MVRRYSGSYLECPVTKNRAIELHRSFAYSILASFRMGMSGSASFQRVRETRGASLLRQPHLPHQLSVSWIGTQGVEEEIGLQTQQQPIALLIRSIEPLEGPLFVSQIG